MYMYICTQTYTWWRIVASINMITFVAAFIGEGGNRSNVLTLLASFYISGHSHHNICVALCFAYFSNFRRNRYHSNPHSNSQTSVFHISTCWTKTFSEFSLIFQTCCIGYSWKQFHKPPTERRCVIVWILVVTRRQCQAENLSKIQLLLLHLYRFGVLYMSVPISQCSISWLFLECRTLSHFCVIPLCLWTHYLLRLCFHYCPSSVLHPPSSIQYKIFNTNIHEREVVKVVKTHFIRSNPKYVKLGKARIPKTDEFSENFQGREVIRLSKIQIFFYNDVKRCQNAQMSTFPQNLAIFFPCKNGEGVKGCLEFLQRIYTIFHEPSAFLHNTDRVFPLCDTVILCTSAVCVCRLKVFIRSHVTLKVFIGSRVTLKVFIGSQVAPSQGCFATQ